MTVQVLICDDQEAFRAAAREVVNATDGFEVIGEPVSLGPVQVRRLQPHMEALLLKREN